jgi:hypothetical protein
VLPDVVAHDGVEALAHAVVLVGRADDLELAAMMAPQPRLGV